ncbi:hypothetical protein C8F04DRAFT_1278807 [Mycena alexandri]|uniref:CCHC-type domain-containing protein n=1 Tax=Mycena alexandri TaxID=1745969 RepID=A0AAD6WM72_9AGAR|nr:hypothetical protein C8F04DRAFT_1278807 [Mycena alexandri]
MPEERWLPVVDVIALGDAIDLDQYKQLTGFPWPHPVSNDADSQIKRLVQEVKATMWTELPLLAIAEAYRKRAEDLIAQGTDSGNARAVYNEYAKYLALHPEKKSEDYNELNRERGSQESMTEYQRRLEAGKRSARISREWRESREQADREYAMKLQAEYDRVEAERVADELRLESETRELERQREELEKTKQKLRKIHRRKENGGDSTSKVSKLDISNETPPPPPAQSTSASTNHPIRDVPPTMTERNTHTFADRVVLQKYRREDFAKQGWSGIEDQGIEWDADGKPFSARLAPSRGSSVGTIGGKRKTPSTAFKQDGTPSGTGGARSMPADVREEKVERSRSQKSTALSEGKVTTARSRTGTGGRKTTHREPDSSDSSSSSSSSDSESDSDSDMPKTEYDSDEASDSAWDKDPNDLISEVYSAIPEESADERPVRGRVRGDEGEPDDSSSSSSSSDDDKNHRSDELSTAEEKNKRTEKGPSKTPRKHPKESERLHRRRRKRNSRRKHHKRARSADSFHLYEAGDPLLAGMPAKQMKKWKRSLHAPFIRHFKEHLGRAKQGPSILDENRNIRIPPPEKYSGSKDIKNFETHIASIVQWFEIIGYGGPDFDDKRKGLHSFYLTGDAKDWYESRVCGIQRAKKKWTHLEMILGLFDHFIDTSCVQRATDEFWNAKFSPEIGVAGFYHELVTKANRMVKRPDSYTFKNHFMGKMPAPMVKHLVGRNVTAEGCTIGEILRTAVNYEMQKGINERYAEVRERERGTPPKKAATAATPSNARGKDEARGISREDLKRKMFRFVKRETSNAKDEEMRAAYQRPGGGRDGGGKGGKKQVECYTCGGPHYKNECPQNKSAKMFAQRDIVNDVSDEGGDSESPRGTRSEAALEQLRNVQEEEDAYTSEGGYTMQEYSDYALSDADERCAPMRPRDIPDLLADESESEEEEEEAVIWTCSAKARAKREKARRYAEKHAGLFNVCDDWDSLELLDNRDLERIAKEMADHIVWQGDTVEVEEFLFATGDRISLSQKPEIARKRQIHLRKSARVKARPPRKKEEVYPLTSYITINGHQAFTLFDTGCTTDSCSPDFARVANIKVHEIEEPVGLQLGTAGSRSKINFGAEVKMEYATLNSDEYLDVVNLDRYDAVVGTKYMRKHGISCDLWKNTIRIKGVPAPTLTAMEEAAEVVRRNAARRAE